MVQLRRAGQSEKRDYGIESLQYPQELGQPGNSHYVVFFINVPSQSKVGESAEAVYTPQKTDRATSSAQSALKDVSIGEVVISAPSKQLKSAIALYMPNNWEERYSAQWEKAEYGNLVNLMAESYTKSGGQTGEFLKEFGKGVASRAGQGVVGGIADLVGGEGFGAGLTKKISNPNTEQVFNGMEHRQFHFEWLMSPKSQIEADNVKRIIEMFRYHMHPELAAGRYLIFPAEFEIEFYSDNNVNNFVGSLSTCVLTNMSVNYTPNGAWSAFKDTRGYPTSVTLQLEFTEVEPLTKDRLEDFAENPYGQTHRTSQPTSSEPAIPGDQYSGGGGAGGGAGASGQWGTPTVNPRDAR